MLKAVNWRKRACGRRHQPRTIDPNGSGFVRATWIAQERCRPITLMDE